MGSDRKVLVVGNLLEAIVERKTPRFDYVVPGLHSRDAFRSGTMRADVERVRRKPKVKYWEVTGNRRERRDLLRIAGWPSLSWKDQPPPIDALADVA